MRMITKVKNKGKKEYAKLKSKDEKDILSQCKNKYVLRKYNKLNA